MINRRVHGVMLLAASAAAAAFIPVTAAPAGAATTFKVPEVSFAGTAAGTVTATLRNPNDRGRCWAEAGIGPDNNHRFFGDGSPDSLANPGQTIKISMTGLEPGTTITARGGCANDAPGEYLLGDTVTVTVPKDKPATGSFGF
ncbi:hypothetical protein [Nocardia sp. NPDC052566]|uniref:hypothetical protein n=1 Tax=Nocardia sp. NPDC052566 TaxID=3364330 RepID=UPI0037C7704B